MDSNVSLLWTGGWDSTFRLVELSFEDVDIYPVYVLDPTRKSKDLELKRMQQIIEVLNLKPLTKARIHNIEIIHRDSIPADEEITQAYKVISAKTGLGIQHEWLARLGKIRPGMEMGTEGGDPETNHNLQTIRDFGTLILEGNTGYLDPDCSSKEGLLVLGWFRFPIITRTEQDMAHLIREWGYEDVMKHIWFCHVPIHGEPCGWCHPCELKIESDMAFLLPESAQKRYQFYTSISRVFGKHMADLSRKVLRRLARII